MTKERLQLLGIMILLWLVGAVALNQLGVWAVLPPICPLVSLMVVIAIWLALG